MNTEQMNVCLSSDSLDEVDVMSSSFVSVQAERCNAPANGKHHVFWVSKAPDGRCDGLRKVLTLGDFLT